jgi:4-hydroxybenzoate polyprenyltransferase
VGGAAAEGVAIVGAFLVLQIAGDAMMCDLDDADADRRFGTTTVANRFGRSAAWRVAFVLQATGAVALLAGAVSGWVDRTAAIVLCAALAGGGAALVAARPATVRDLVDARFPVAVAIAWGVAALIP